MDKLNEPCKKSEILCQKFPIFSLQIKRYVIEFQHNKNKYC